MSIHPRSIPLLWGVVFFDENRVSTKGTGYELRLHGRLYRRWEALLPNSGHPSEVTTANGHPCRPDGSISQGLFLQTRCFGWKFHALPWAYGPWFRPVIPPRAVPWQDGYSHRGHNVDLPPWNPPSPYPAHSPDADASPLQGGAHQFFLVRNHVQPTIGSQLIKGGQLNGISRAGFFAHSAENTTNEVHFEV